MPPLHLPGLLPALSLTFASLFPIASCMCYVSNGSAVLNWGSDSVYQPCSRDSSNPLSTICCAINRSNPPGGNIANGFTQDICLPSGLCQNILVNADGDTVYAYWRDYCTVNDYTSSKCLDVCTGNGEASPGGTAEVTPCGANNTVTKWCCGQNNTACCFEDSAQNIPVSLGVSSTSSSSASSSSTSSSSTSSSSTTTSASATTTTISTPSSTTSSNSNNNNTGLTTGDKAGIGVGIAGGAVLFVGLGLSIAWFRRRRKEKPAAYELRTPQGAYSDAPKYAQFSPAPLSEMGGREPSEMAAEEERRPVEMA